MSVDRRSFVIGVLATAASGSFARANWSTVPPWVPPGFPAFYEDAAFSNLIVHKDRPDSDDDDYTKWTNNGGDTAQREGFTWFGIWLLQKLGIQPVVIPTLGWFDAIKLLEDPQKPGEFRRHPNPDPRWKWNDPTIFSRDQQTPIVAALGALGPSQTLQRLWSAFDGRGRICQNGDAGGLDHQNLFFRALHAQNLRAGQQQIEAFGEFLLAVMAASIAGRGAADPDDVGDDLNFVVNLSAAAAPQWRPTKTSASTILEYVKTRPINYGCYLEQYRQLHKDLLHDKKMMISRIREIMAGDAKPECHPIVGALRWYFRAEVGAPWGPAALYEQVVTTIFH
jgi:hypothetical protein